MVLIKEFRVVLPCSVQEYQVGQLYSVAEASKNETGGGEGIEVLKNEPYEKDGEKGQYTHKIYHLKSKVPAFVRMIAPEGSLVFHEKAWNAYPYCRTIVTNEYMKDDFFIKIETWHKPDLGTLENVHGLDPNTWKTVEIVHIDIADRSQVEPADYKADEDPALFQSVKTKRGPLGPNWKYLLAVYAGLESGKDTFPWCQALCEVVFHLHDLPVGGKRLYCSRRERKLCFAPVNILRTGQTSWNSFGFCGS
ncbi:phosphatidylinositol transfer protein beta isoform isoform X3 [Lynx rufus]|uniref:phosphatidylinositol transfer protein beta isoform isoform X3 n=1 Tax=Lynx rufus TaxID=61384 RepID=UPI001F12479E|nr:phosphatidylinositol transfer protein beta isoform isoform X3 [Lynx rufus]